MSFSKITRAQGDVATLTAAYKQRISHQDAIQLAKRELARAVHDLGPPADPEADTKALAEAKLRASALEAEIALGETGVESQQAAIQTAEARHALCVEEAADCAEDVAGCEAELRSHEEAAGPVRKLTDKERAWLAAFASVSRDPPSQSMYLLLALDKAKAKSEAAKTRAGEQAQALATLRHDLDSARQRQDERAQEQAAVALRIEQIKAREPGHKRVNDLRAKLDTLSKTDTGAVGTERSLIGTLHPFRHLATEMSTTLGQIAAGGGVFGEAVAKLDDFKERAATLTGSIQRLEGLSGEEALRSITYLPELATAMNQLADAVTQFETEVLPKTRKAALTASKTKDLTTFAGTLPYSAAFLPAQQTLLVQNLDKLDGLDWAATEAAASLLLDARRKRLQAQNDAEDLRLKTAAAKAAAFEAVSAKLKSEFEAGRLTKKKYNPITEGVRSDKIDLATFQQMLADAKTEYEAALALKKLNDDGEFFTPTQWREKLGLTGSKTDWGMLYHENGEHKGAKWNLHFSISNDSIAPSTSWIKLRGNTTDKVYADLFIDAVERKYRMHATFQMAGTGADSNVHLYLGDDTYYRENLIPYAIKSEIKAKMKTMRSKYITEMKAIIKGLLLPKKDDADAV